MTNAGSRPKAADRPVLVTGATGYIGADAQLASFKRLLSPKARFLREGLWRYSRHPNYFGEVLAWWGIYVIALAVPGGWATVVGPVIITALILWVSGVPLLESRYAGVPEFEDYKQTTNAFFPWRPKASRG